MIRKTQIVTLFLVIFNAAMFIACSGGGSAQNDEKPASDRESPEPAQTTKWYEGGTLHKKNALDWQKATEADKLATCADFVTSMWQKGNLKPEIENRLSDVDDVKPYAQELVDFLDAAFERDPDSEQNRKMFKNQSVSGTAAMGMVKMGWTK